MRLHPGHAVLQQLRDGLRDDGEPVSAAAGDAACVRHVLHGGSAAALQGGLLRVGVQPEPLQDPLRHLHHLQNEPLLQYGEEINMKIAPFQCYII